MILKFEPHVTTLTKGRCRNIKVNIWSMPQHQKKIITTSTRQKDNVTTMKNACHDIVMLYPQKVISGLFNPVYI